MKKYLVSFVLLSAVAAFFISAFHSSAQDASRTDAPAASTTLVLSQVSGGNGYYSNDWVEIKNVSAATQSLNGLSLYYGSALGNFGAGSFPLPNTSLLPGQYYLVQLNSAAPGTTPLPVPPDASTINISMSGSSGKVGLVNAAALATNTCGATATPCSASQLAAFVDWVAYGAAGNGTANIGEGGNPSVNNGVALVSTQGAARKLAGCQDTDNNNDDFDIFTNPPTPPLSQPHNSSSALAPCGGGSGVLQGSGNANPNIVAPGGTTLLTVSVAPAASPPSTGITVVANLSSIGGSATQTFFDDGTHGDVTPGNNVFSFSETIPTNASVGSFSLAVNISDAQNRTATASISLTINVVVPHSAAEHLVMGNPSGAITNVNNPTNYLLEKTQYVMSYNRDRGGPNWVAWHLDSSWVGSVSRQDDFRPDPSLPAGWYQVLDTDYSGSGFDRGHHCPSGDRTDTVADNSATFFMTNMMPQAANNNQGVWADLENYCRSLVDGGYELYIYAGGTGIGGTGTLGGVTNTIANGHVTVPAQTWKVIVVLPVGSNDEQRVNSFTRVITVLMPNSNTALPNPGSGNWKNYRTNVAKIEQITGFNFLTKVRPQVRVRLKKHVDNQ
jgi:endonuclease G